MKYVSQNLTKDLSNEKRSEYNKKILYLINTNNTKDNISNEEIYNIYSEKGGNHDIMFKDYDGNFYEYSKDKKAIEEGQFFTPDNIIAQMYDIVKPSSSDLISDLTAGKGSFINHCPNEKNFYANEIDSNAVMVMRHLFPLSNISNMSIEHYNTDVKFNIIFGNPPFNLYITNQQIKSQHYYFLKSHKFLQKGGFLVVLVPDSYLKDEYYYKNYIDQINDMYNFVGQYKLKSNAFDNANISTKVMIFINKCDNIDYDQKFDNEYSTIEEIKTKVNNLKLIIDKNKNRIFLENRKHGDNNFSFSNPRSNVKEECNGYNFMLRKYLFEIKQHHNDKLMLAYNYIDKFKNQARLDGTSIDEWSKICITENKVLAYLRKILKTKNNKTFKYQNLSKKKANQKAKELAIQTASFKDVENNNINFDKMVYDSINDEYITLNDMQVDICSKLLYKKYSMLQAEQGTGKTLMGIHIGLKRLQSQQCNNVFVLAPAIAIKGTWSTVLNDYNIPNVLITKASDINNIKTGDFVLCTFHSLSKYSKMLKKYLKIKKYNIQTILDESDSICNITSSRAKTTHSILYKSKYKLLLSGTLSRNNIAELYTQFKFLYGESYNFVNDCEYMYALDNEKDDNAIIVVKNERGQIKTSNDIYNKPFPSYRKGYTMFRQCYNPEVTTVFGISKNTQNIYNSVSLRNLCDKTIITKSFKEIVGKKIHKIEQHFVKFNSSEYQLYYTAINEFYKMKYLFKSTGEPRKDRMLEIIQQLTLMLDICSQPQMYCEYDNNVVPKKYSKVMELLKTYSNEKVAIGCRTLNEVQLYIDLIGKVYPDRKICRIDGSVDINKRKSMIEQLKSESNTILISTQQSLSSSMNIGFINQIIITRLPWNLSTLSQYYCRFVRFNSVDFKTIHIVTYSSSLESNLLKLICTKENLIKFTKNNDEANIEDDMGIDESLIDMLLSKEKDKDGKTYISWGTQTVE